MRNRIRWRASEGTPSAWPNMRVEVVGSPAEWASPTMRIHLE